MPYDDPEPSDPLTLHGVVVETEDDGAMRDMAECFVEEYVRSGFDADRILRMFQTQGYAGPFQAYQTLGYDVIRAMIDGQSSLRNRTRSQEPSEQKAPHLISLPVLDS